jgi:N-acyl-D-aspartate/D-glutamate deacylase
VKYDLLIRNGTVVREDRVERADVAVSDEKIVEVAPDLPGHARETIDAFGLHVFPGLSRVGRSGRVLRRARQRLQRVVERSSSTCR